MLPVHNIVALCCALISWVGFHGFASAEVLSRAVGHDSVVCAGGSDTVVSIPFHRPPGFSSAVDGSPVVSATTATLSHKSERVLENGDLTTEPHYLQFAGGGARSGSVYPVLSHDAGSITIDLGGDNLTGVTDGDRFQVIPFWTLATLFPKDTQSTVHESTGKLAPTRKTRVLFFDDVSQGADLAPDRIYFLTSEGWFRSGRGFPAADDTVVPPGKALVIRHLTGDASTPFVPRHLVFDGDHTTPLKTQIAASQDTATALVRPVPVKLSDLDLDTDFSNSASTAAGSRSDELLLFDNVATGYNKQAATTYFKVAGKWHRDDGSTYPVADDDAIPSSTGILIRKAANGSGATLLWSNSPRY